jgi:hypothetical protein
VGVGSGAWLGVFFSVFEVEGGVIRGTTIRILSGLSVGGNGATAGETLWEYRALSCASLSAVAQRNDFQDATAVRN